MVSTTLFIISLVVLLPVYKNTASDFYGKSHELITKNISPISPEQTISEYILLSRENRISDVNNLITALPNSYLRHILSAKSRPQSIKKESRSSVTDENGETIFLTIEDEVREFRKSSETLINEFLTVSYPNNIRITKLEFEKVISKKIKDNDACIQVKLRSYKNETYDRELFFFLHKEDQGWKIFFITGFVYDNNDFPY